MKIYYIEGLHPFYEEPQQSYLIDTDFGFIEFIYESDSGVWSRCQMFESMTDYKNCWSNFDADAIMVRVAK